MQDDRNVSTGAKAVRRRAVLSLAVVVGSVVTIAGSDQQPTARSSAYRGRGLSRIDPAGRAVQEAKGAHESLKTVGAAPAKILSRYRDVYQSVPNIVSSFFRTPDGELKIVGVSAGLSHQLQVLDAATGKREFSANPFPKNGGGVGNVAVNFKDGTLLAYGADKTVHYVGPDGITSSAYVSDPDSTHSSFAVATDSKGRIWNGNYPAGNATRHDPETGETIRTSRLSPYAQYVRALAIDDADNVYAGTGARLPSIFTWHSSSPTKIKEIKLAESRRTGFVRRIEAHRDVLFVYVTEEDGAPNFSIYSLTDQRWLKVPQKWGPSVVVSASLPGSSDIFAISVSGSTYRLIRIDGTTLKASVVCEVPGAARALKIERTAKKIFANLVCEASSGFRYLRISLSRGAIIKDVRADFAARTLRVQTLLPAREGNRVYFGGYLGAGLGRLDLLNGETWLSAPLSGVKQVEGMLEYDARTIYIGSYTGGVLFRFNPVTGAIKRLISLREKFFQSRPCCWATAGEKVVAGTIPEYGRNGGALVFLNPRKDSDIRVVRCPVAGQSVLGLVGEGRVIYGTTGVRGGYGARDDPKPAHIFAWDVVKSKLLWKRALSGESEINSPILVDGQLLVSTARGVFVISKEDGSLEKSYLLFDRSLPPRYKTSTLSHLERLNCVAHLCGGVVTVIDMQREVRSEVLRGAYSDMIVDVTGRLVLVENGSNIVEVNVGSPGY